MKNKRIVRHRNRGLVIIREREYFKGFAAFDTLVNRPVALKGWEVRVLERMGVNM